MTMKLLFLLLSSLLYTKASLLPPYLDRSCISDIVEAANNAIPLLFSGDDNYNIVQFNPYREAQRLLLNNESGIFIFNNVRLYGLDTITVLDIQVNISTGILTAEYNFLRLKFRAASQINFPNTPVSGYGPGGLILDNLNVTQTINFAMDSDDHVFLTNGVVTIAADNIDIDLPYLDADAREYMENNKEYFIGLLRPNIGRTINGILSSPVVAIGELVTSGNIFDFSC